MQVFGVAQIFNLLYRRIAFCGTQARADAFELSDGFADYKSAIQRIENLRYETAAGEETNPSS